MKTKGKKAVFLWGFVTPITIVPLTLLAANSLGFLPVMIPAPAPRAVEPKAIVPAPPMTEALSQRGLSVQYSDGILQAFDPAGRRVEKIRFSERGDVLEHWFFDGELNRINRYEKYDYAENGDYQHRIAIWAYREDGAFVKTNEISNQKGEPLGSFVEHVGPTGVKFQEDWYDIQKRLTTRKNWDLGTGEFADHVRIQYLMGGLMRSTHLNEHGQGVGEVITNAEGKVVKLGLIGFGKRADLERLKKNLPPKD